ncbi:MAG: proton-conducting transporter transmembrane domain-containing protein [Armatimonadota bacterium]
MNPVLMILILPLLMAVLGLNPRGSRWLPWTSAALMLLQIPVVAWLCRPLLSGAAPISAEFTIDGTGAAFLLITTIVATASIVQSALLLPAERAGEHAVTDRRFCLFYTLAGLFLCAMYLVLLAQNLGYLWIAMEATTLLSAPLIYYHRSRRSLEATWKYLLLCSVGIAFALFGTMLIFAAQHQLTTGPTLLLPDLMAHAPALDTRLLRLGFIFCLLGYGTKAGLFPLHNWLPDAHSEAPAPASAMLSGALLNCALVAIWRLSQLMIAAGQPELIRQILIPAGAITVLAASLMLVRQHDLKRLWAYSSVEHVGLLALAIGLGTGPIFILHALNHSLVKVLLFLLAGNFVQAFGTKRLSALGGLLTSAPAWGFILAAGSFAIAGSPPFGTFLSEWLLLRNTFAAGEFLAAGVVIVGLTITFIAIASHMAQVLFGAPRTAIAHPAESHAASESGGVAETVCGLTCATGPADRTTAIPPARSWSIVPIILLGLSLLAGLMLTPNVMTILTTLAQGVQ